LTKPRTAESASEPKRQFLVHLDAGLIRRIKVLAIDRGVSASSLVQEALLAYLPPSTPATRKPAGKK
jgi:Ribbon-helix-helix protein, copG family